MGTRWTLNSWFCIEFLLAPLLLWIAIVQCSIPLDPIPKKPKVPSFKCYQDNLIFRGPEWFLWALLKIQLHVGYQLIQCLTGTKPTQTLLYMGFCFIGWSKSAGTQEYACFESNWTGFHEFLFPFIREIIFITKLGLLTGHTSPKFENSKKMFN